MEIRAGDIVKINKEPLDCIGDLHYIQFNGKLGKVLVGQDAELGIIDNEFEKWWRIIDFKNNHIAYYTKDSISVLGSKITKIINILYGN